MIRRWRMGVILGALAACAHEDPGLTRALESIAPGDLAATIEVLAADSFEGRAPSSPGEEKTTAYLRRRFEALGLRPGNGNSFFQEVPLVSIAADRHMTLTTRGRGSSNAFRYSDEFMAWTNRVVNRVSLTGSEMVFVGYGVVAPEVGWNDYQGIDVRGKTVVMLVNDPDFATAGSELFNGRAMTYYGRWTYKYEEAARQGAAGAFIVHETEPAGYPWEVVSGSWSGARFGLETPDGNMSRAAVEGWFTLESARRVFGQAGLSYDSLKAAAARQGFRAVPMGLTASVAVRNTIRHSMSKNVLALLPGSSRPDEVVIYMAHWDHLGRDPTREGDQIFNGAEDNATGTAGLLELAEAFTTREPPPQRSILFLAVTAEEQGLLGSAHYGRNPVYPLAKTVAAINMDVLNVLGPMRDITVVGFGSSDLDSYLIEAAATQGRVVQPDPEPEKGFYYRSDHFELAKVGVPALYTDAGIDHVAYGEDWSRAQRDTYTAERYHKPADEYNPNWDLRGAVDDLRLMFRVGDRLANETTFVNWSDGTEFKARRDSMMGGSR